jgi:hypothetical protein
MKRKIFLVIEKDPQKTVAHDEDVSSRIDADIDKILYLDDDDSLISVEWTMLFKDGPATIGLSYQFNIRYDAGYGYPLDTAVKNISVPLLRQYPVAQIRPPQLFAAVGQLHRRSRNGGPALQGLTLLLHAQDLPQLETPILETAGLLSQKTTSCNLIPSKPPVTKVFIPPRGILIRRPVIRVKKKNPFRINPHPIYSLWQAPARDPFVLTS